MRPYLVVIFHVRQQYMMEVSLAEHNNVVKALPSDRTDQPFGISVLPWGARRCRPPSCTAVVHEISQRDKDTFIFGEGCAGLLTHTAAVTSAAAAAKGLRFLKSPRRQFSDEGVGGDSEFSRPALRHAQDTER